MKKNKTGNLKEIEDFFLIRRFVRDKMLLRFPVNKYLEKIFYTTLYHV